MHRTKMGKTRRKERQRDLDLKEGYSLQILFRFLAFRTLNHTKPRGTLYIYIPVGSKMQPAAFINWFSKNPYFIVLKVAVCKMHTNQKLNAYKPETKKLCIINNWRS